MYELSRDVSVRDKHRLILVTGAPRTATTPFASSLALARGVHVLYEPMGPTGDVRIPSRFAVPGEVGFSRAMFAEFVADLKRPRLQLRGQVRKAHRRLSPVDRYVRRMIGSRTRISYVSARVRLGLKTIVWKDPMAAFTVPDVLALGIPTVVCLRSPLAHAASFKRRGWSGEIETVYPNFRAVYGPVEAVEDFLRSSEFKRSSVQSAAILWHLVYTLVQRVIDEEFGELPGHLMIMSSTALEARELDVYERAYKLLGLEFSDRVRKRLASRVEGARESDIPPARIHAWDRSVSSTNSYWKQTLAGDEIAFVNRLNGDLFGQLETPSSDRNCCATWL